MDAITTIADGLSAPFAGPNTFAHCRALLDDLVRIDDDEIVRAMQLLIERAKVAAEPAGAAAVAALLAGRVGGLDDAVRVVAVVSGGNVDRGRLAEFLAAAPDRGEGT